MQTDSVELHHIHNEYLTDEDDGMPVGDKVVTTGNETIELEIRATETKYEEIEIDDELGIKGQGVRRCPA